MNKSEILNRINALLNINVKLSQMTLDDGTIIEADSFEVGQKVSSVDGNTKTPLAVGDYTMSDGMVLTVTEEGVIGEIATAQAEATEVEATSADKPTAMADAPPTIDEIISSVSDAMQKKLDDLQSQIDELKGSQTKIKETLSSVSEKKATVHKPFERTTLASVNSGNNLSSTEARIMKALSN